MNGKNHTFGAGLAVLEREKLQFYNLDPKSEWLVGRYDPIHAAAVPDIPLDSCLASRIHGWMYRGRSGWYFIDNPQNTNGTFCNGVKIRRTGRRRLTDLTDGTVLAIDSPDGSHDGRDGVKMLFLADCPSGPWRVCSLREKELVRIGGNDGDAEIPFGQARLLLLNGTWYLSDNTGTTRLMDRVLENAMPLEEGARFRVGESVFYFLGSCLMYTR